MPSYHLLSTRRNSDGSFATPSIDEVLTATDESAAVRKARNFPIEHYDVESDVSWLVDEAGQVVWTRDWAQAA